MQNHSKNDEWNARIISTSKLRHLTISGSITLYNPALMDNDLADYILERAVHHKLAYHKLTCRVNDKLVPLEVIFDEL